MNAPEGAYLIVRVDGQEFGFAVNRVQTVIETREVTPIPGRPKFFAGALNHHGELLLVAPLAPLLDRHSDGKLNYSIIVVVKWDDALVGLQVESALGLLTQMDHIRVAHVLGRWDGPYLVNTLEVEGRRIHVIDLESLLQDLSGRL